MIQNKDPKSLLDDSNALYADLKGMHDRMAQKLSDVADTEASTVEKYASGATQWGVRGRQFAPTGNTVSTLPAGWYKFSWNGYMMVPELLDVRNDELIKLPMPEYDAVLDDMKRFWESEDKYRKYNFPYKRGIVLYGRPGTGKSGLIRLLGDDLITQYKGVLFNLGSPDDIYAFESIFSVFRELEPDRKAICVMEDVDNFVRYGGSTQAKLLNILDGNMRYDNIVFLATTNFPEMLLESLSNRPSRFDRRYEVGTPSAEARSVYISTKFKGLPKDELEKLVTATEGFNIDMLKETVLSIYVLGYDFDKVVEDMKGLFVYNGRVGENVDRFKKAGGYDSVQHDDAHELFEQELNK